MRYKVEIRAKVLKALARIPRTDRARIEREIESLGQPAAERLPARRNRGAKHLPRPLWSLSDHLYRPR